jgi:adenylate cyclase
MTTADVHQWLRERGVSDDEIEQAAAQHTLHLLVADHVVVPEPARYTAPEVDRLTGMPQEQNRRLWRALGFPDVPDDERVFTDADVQAITIVQGLLSLGIIDEEGMIPLTRVIGSSMARIAEAEVESSPMMHQEEASDEVAELYVLVADSILPDMGRLLEYAWRRHLQAALRQAGLRRPRTSETGAVDLAIGFADLVGYTSLSQQLSEGALAELVGHFEDLAYETVAQLGGRVVKMIGDAAMFVCNDAADAASIALALSAAYAGDDMLTEVRVGLAAGPVLARDGDYFGTTVNLASRIVNIAAPGSVLVDGEVRQRLGGDGRFAWKSLRPRYLKDIGRVPLWVLFDPGADDDRRRPRRLGLIREAVREQVERAHAVGKEVVGEV